MEVFHVQVIGGGFTGTLVEGIVQDELSVGTDLRVVSGLELPVPHVVLLHPHKRGIGVCLGVVVAPVENLSLGFVFLQLFGPCLPHAPDLGLHFPVRIRSLQSLMYLLQCPFHLLGGDVLVSDWSGVTQLLLGDGLGVPPYLLKLFRDSGDADVDRLAPDERITVGVCLHLRSVGAGHVQLTKPSATRNVTMVAKTVLSTSFSRLLRKRLMVLWSGTLVLVSHMKRMSI